MWLSGIVLIQMYYNIDSFVNYKSILQYSPIVKYISYICESPGECV